MILYQSVQQFVINNQFNFWTDAFVPFICAVVGGVLALIGVVITLRHEKAQSKRDYLERIRPFITIDSPMLTNTDFKETRDVFIFDDSEQKEEKSSTIYKLNVFIFSNAGEAVCMIDYLRINGKKFDCIYHIPLKPNESALLVGKPLSLYLSDDGIKSISIGLSDRLSNQYEYGLGFEISKNEGLICIPFTGNYSIEIKSVDCMNNLLNSK